MVKGNVMPVTPVAIPSERNLRVRARANEESTQRITKRPTSQRANRCNRGGAKTVFWLDARSFVLNANTIDEQLKARAIVGGCNVSPVGGRLRSIGNLLCLFCIGTGRIKLGIPASILNTDGEVLAKELFIRRVGLIRPNSAFDDRLYAGTFGVFTLHPTFNRIIEERQLSRNRQRTRTDFRRFKRIHQERLFAVKPHRLTTTRRVHVLRIGCRLGLALPFLKIAQVVMV